MYYSCLEGFLVDMTKYPYAGQLSILGSSWDAGLSHGNLVPLRRSHVISLGQF